MSVNRKRFKKNKDLIKSTIVKAVEKANLPKEKKLADYILRLNNIKLDSKSIKEILRGLK